MSIKVDRSSVAGWPRRPFITTSNYRGDSLISLMHARYVPHNSTRPFGKVFSILSGGQASNCPTSNKCETMRATNPRCNGNSSWPEFTRRHRESPRATRLVVRTLKPRKMKHARMRRVNKISGSSIRARDQVTVSRRLILRTHSSRDRPSRCALRLHGFHLLDLDRYRRL